MFHTGFSCIVQGVYHPAFYLGRNKCREINNGTFCISVSFAVCLRLALLFVVHLAYKEEFIYRSVVVVGMMEQKAGYLQS